MFPFESVATPAASPKWMFAGGFRRLILPSKGISGTWAESNPQASRKTVVQVSFIELLFPVRVQHQLLRPPQLDFRNVEHIGIPAIDLMQSTEFAQLLARFSEFPDDC